MKVKELIEQLQKCDPDANVWQMYDPPFACGEIKLTHLVGENEDYAKMFSDEGVKIGDYAVISG